MQSELPKIQLTPIMANLEKETGLFSKRDPYCIINYSGKHFRTHTDKDAGREPVWLEHFHLQGSAENMINVQVFDEVLFLPDSFIGEGSVSYTALTHKKKTELWVDLTKDSKFVGKVLVEARIEGYLEDFEKSLDAEKPEIRGGLGETLNKAGFKEDTNPLDSQESLPTNIDKVSISKALNEGGFKEANTQEGTKLGGDHNTGGQTQGIQRLAGFHTHSGTGTNPQNEVPVANFGSTLDKQGFKEESAEDLTKIAGTSNVSGGSQSTGKGGVESNSLKSTLEKAGFQESAAQDGSKVHGTPNA